MYLTNLAIVLRSAGLNVEEVGNWKSHGHGGLISVRGIIWHHTAGAKTGNYPSMGTVKNGRPGLPGPLSQLGLGRDGTWYVLAAGRAWHAGEGSSSFVPPNRGNDYLIGIEAENTGYPSDPWPEVQLESYRRGTAALLKAYNLPSSRVIGHKEWAPGRKVDPHSLNMDNERSRVAAYMKSPQPKEWWEMPIPDAELKRIAAAVWGQSKIKTDSGKTLTQGKAAEYNYNRIGRLGVLLDDEQKLTKVITEVTSGLPGADKDTIKAAFVEALREVLTVEEN